MFRGKNKAGKGRTHSTDGLILTAEDFVAAFAQREHRGSGTSHPTQRHSHSKTIATSDPRRRLLGTDPLFGRKARTIEDVEQDLDSFARKRFGI